MAEERFTKTLTLQPWSDALAENLVTFPDYLIHRLAVGGIGRIESEPAVEGGDSIWRYVSRRTGTSEEFARSPANSFRPLLARWATFSGADLYCGHTLFAVEAHPRWPSSGTHRFSLFVCNEPTMAFWFKLYLYCIDGMWPMPKSDGGPAAT